jgi:predicted ATPase
MLSLHIKNLRSIKDSTRIDLRPLTLVVGRNSAGKSTLLRVLPLLRQSVERRTSGPLLWFGDLVDFGSFNDAVRRGAEKREIELEFGIELPSRAGRFGEQTRPESVPSRITLVIGNGDRQPSITRLGFRCGEDAAELRLSADGTVETAVARGESVDLLKIAAKYGRDRTPFSNFSLGDADPETAGEGVVEALRPFMVEEEDANELQHLAQALDWTAPPHRPALINRIENWLGRNGEAGEATAQRLYDALFVRDLARTIAEALQALAAEASAVAYLGPFRDPPRRHYRVNELAMDVIDADGSNTAMVIRSLSPEAREDLSAWLTGHLGFGVEVKDTDAHVQIQVTEGTRPAANLIDVGFGVSQLLPVAVQLWLLMNPRDGVPPTFRTFVMEQPELHLHPAHQARLGTLLASAAATLAQVRTDESPRTLMVETHSADLVEAVGRAIFEGTLPADAAQVVVVEKDDATGDSTVRVATFDECGELQNWPAGFFVP